jgi:uncharacterized protein
MDHRTFIRLPRSPAGIPTIAPLYTLRVIAKRIPPIDPVCKSMAQTRRKTIVTSTSTLRVPSESHFHLRMDFAQVKGHTEPGEVCAYNQTRECFLGLHVVSGDFTIASFHEWMATLKPNSAAGMWMVPFRGIAATEVRVPLDLLYLDEDCRVIEAVEFFPTFRVSPGSAPAASVLALPTHSIFSSRTQAGDQLMLHPADQMEWRLDEVAQAASEGIVTPPAQTKSALGPVLVREKPKASAAPPTPREQLIVREQPVSNLDSVPAPPLPAPTVPAQPQQAVLPQAPQAAAMPEPAQPDPAQPDPAQLEPTQLPEPAQPIAPPPPENRKPWMAPARQAGKARRGWLARWLYSDSADPRKTSRRPVTGLVAHFFTGGAPQAHEIRDVSETGLYVVTAERWYPGTIIRMTLTKPDKAHSPSGRSITIQARSMRWGNDGVGLEFVIEAAQNSRRVQPTSFDPVDGKQLDAFLHPLGKADV